MVAKVPRVSPDVSKVLAHRPRRMSQTARGGHLDLAACPGGKFVHRSIPWPTKGSEPKRDWRLVSSRNGCVRCE